MQLPNPVNPPLVSRRRFLRRSLQAAAGLTGLAAASVSYGFWEASQIRVVRENVCVPRLPQAFAGKTIAVLADFHLGPYVSIGFIKRAVRLAGSLHPDAFALVGDFGHKEKQAVEQIHGCLDALSVLRAPLGVFAVPGNHDMCAGGKVYREAVHSTPITDLTNRSVRLSLQGESLWLAGVDDLWWGKPDLRSALYGIPSGAAIILLSHNPDFAEEYPDARVGLVLSGHTHGGQVYLPCFGAPWMPSRYGDKYRHGLVQGPASNVFITRGLGEAGIPLRVNSPPEINLLTLLPADSRAA